MDVIGLFQETAQNYVRNIIDNLHWKKPDTTEFLMHKKMKRDSIVYQMIVNYEGRFYNDPLLNH